MANEHSVDYHPSLLGLTTRVHPLIFLHLSLEFLGKIFKFIENVFAGQKFESRHFYSCLLNSPQVLIITPKQKGITHPPRQPIFWRSISLQEKGGGRNVLKLAVIYYFVLPYATHTIIFSSQYFTQWVLHYCLYMMEYMFVRWNWI